MSKLLQQLHGERDVAMLRNDADELRHISERLSVARVLPYETAVQTAQPHAERESAVVRSLRAELHSARMRVLALEHALNERGLSPEFIAKQRAQGWPDIHPEDFCHRCGAKNVAWSATREDWLVATREWSTVTGREGICCVTCFAQMYEQETGDTKAIWMLTRFGKELP